MHWFYIVLIWQLYCITLMFQNYGRLITQKNPKPYSYIIFTSQYITKVLILGQNRNLNSDRWGQKLIRRKKKAPPHFFEQNEWIWEWSTPYIRPNMVVSGLLMSSPLGLWVGTTCRGDPLGLGLGSSVSHDQFLGHYHSWYSLRAPHLHHLYGLVLPCVSKSS